MTLRSTVLFGFVASTTRPMVSARSEHPSPDQLIPSGGYVTGSVCVTPNHQTCHAHKGGRIGTSAVPSGSFLPDPVINAFWHLHRNHAVRHTAPDGNVLIAPPVPADERGGAVNRKLLQQCRVAVNRQPKRHSVAPRNSVGIPPQLLANVGTETRITGWYRRSSSRATPPQTSGFCFQTFGRPYHTRISTQMGFQLTQHVTKHMTRHDNQHIAAGR